MWVHFRATRGDGAVGAQGVTRCCHREHQTQPPAPHTPGPGDTSEPPHFSCTPRDQVETARSQVCTHTCKHHGGVCIWRGLFPLPFAPANELGMQESSKNMNLTYRPKIAQTVFVSLGALQGERRHLAGRGAEEGGKKGVTTAQLLLICVCGTGGGKKKKVTGGSESPAWVSFPLALGAASPPGDNQRSANRPGVGLNKLMS